MLSECRKSSFGAYRQKSVRMIIYQEITNDTHLVYASNDMFALENSNKLREYDTVPHALLHLYYTKSQLLSQTTFYPLLSLSNVTEILVGLEKITLNVSPETPCEPSGGQRRSRSAGRLVSG